MARTRIARLVLLAAALALVLSFAGRWPRDQTVHYILGDAAPHVQELDARWARRAAPDSLRDPHAEEDWAREVSFRYAPGHAPRVVTHEPRLADGDYIVEIEIVASDSERKLVRRQVTLGGGVTRIVLDSSFMAEHATRPVWQ